MKQVFPKLTINAVQVNDLTNLYVLLDINLCLQDLLRTKFMALLKEDRTTPSTNAPILTILVKSQLELFKSVDSSIQLHKWYCL